MSFTNDLVALSVAVGASAKVDFDTLNGRIGNLALLNTTSKTSMADAVNEVLAAIQAGGNASIVDGETGPSSTWSSTKISTEIYSAVSAIETGAMINDSLSDWTVAWSAAKVMAAIEEARQEVLDDNVTRTNELIGAAPDLLNTFEEFATAINDDPNFAATMLANDANRLRIDVADQTLTTLQRANGRSNLQVYSQAEVDAIIGDTSVDLVAAYQAARGI